MKCELLVMRESDTMFIRHNIFVFITRNVRVHQFLVARKFIKNKYEIVTRIS